MFEWYMARAVVSGVLLAKNFDKVLVLNKVVKLKSRANVFIILWGCDFVTHSGEVTQPLRDKN